MDRIINEENVSRSDLYEKLWSSSGFERNHSLIDVESPCNAHYPALCIVLFDAR